MARKPDPLLTRRGITCIFGTVRFPERGAFTEIAPSWLKGRAVRIEHTDFHRPTGARLFRVKFVRARSAHQPTDPRFT